MQYLRMYTVCVYIANKLVKVMSRSVKKAQEQYALSTSVSCTQSDTEASVIAGDDTKENWAPIEELHALGIAAADTKRLRESGIFSIQGVLMQTHKDLGQIKGLSEAKVDKILDAARKHSQPGFMSGITALERRQRIRRISTGCSDLDTLLGGGIESMAITEVFGEFRSGKTQLCHTIAVTAQLDGSRVAYLDTEGTFRPEKIGPIAERYKLDPTVTLSKIAYARAYTHEQQIELLAAAAEQMSEKKFALLIIDSLTALFRVDFTGRGELADRQQKLGQHLASLAKLADEFNIAIFVTNQVMAQVDGAAMFTADPKKPIGGHILAHASTTRLYLRKGRGNNRVAKIYDSPSLPEAEATFAVGEQGVCDAEE
ncbi:DNA repair and recombination protein Rad51 [Giardia duodenalis]|uniref:DNA repair protein RAD51 n=2 Tax=Giardia intestinalis TaxID=5741 RepID=C6LTL9_GIAIB|nr:DNA repair protein RAD51 [Giardia intestinalis ATCC 50581]ESU44340.1 DNA repair and recombination protein Rad51 [Giardia intestinalis]